MARKTAAMPPIATPAMVPGPMAWEVLAEVMPSGVGVGVGSVLVDSEVLWMDEMKLEISEDSAELVADNGVIDGAGVAVDEVFDDDSVALDVSFLISIPCFHPGRWRCSYWCLLLSTFSLSLHSSSSA